MIRQRQANFKRRTALALAWKIFYKYVAWRSQRDRADINRLEAETAMLLIDRLAEENILAAARRGEFEDLPGAGKPLRLDDDRAVPEELRVACRILKNAGCLPPEQQLRNEIRQIEGLLGRLEADTDEPMLRRRLLLLKTRFALQGRDVNLLIEEGAYREQLLRRLADRPTR
jgi:hypothetical protein